MLGEHRDDYRGILGPLALVNGRCVGRYQRVEFPKSISDGSAIKAGNDPSRVEVNILDAANFPVVDLLVVVVFHLHHLIAWGKSPAEPLNLLLTRGVEGCLQLDVQ